MRIPGTMKNQTEQIIELNEIEFKSILKRHLNSIVFNMDINQQKIFDDLIKRILKEVIQEGKLQIRIL